MFIAERDRTSRQKRQAETFGRVGRYLSYCLSLVGLVAIAPQAMAAPEPTPVTVAQVAQTKPNSPAAADDETINSSVTSNVVYLDIQPFFGVSYTEENGNTGLTSLESFFPFSQRPGEELSFVTGRLSRRYAGRLSGGLQLGYRTNMNDQAIAGVHGGIDIARVSDENVFAQAGFGTELLADKWDIHFNANIPLGNARQVTTVGSRAATNPRFSRNRLIFDQNFMEQIESAIRTVSLGAGVQLVDFGQDQVLWGRGGVYYLDAETTNNHIGYRLGLDHRLRNNIRLGLGVQNDDVFGTNLTLSFNALVGAPFQRPQAETSASENRLSARLWSRAGEPLRRTNTILVEEQTVAAGSADGTAAINPATGRTYAFQHVSPDEGTDSGNGDIQNQVDAISTAVAVLEAGDDNIIYVRAGDAGGAAVIPEGVQVRSVGPTQVIDTQFGSVELAESGSGVQPTVTGAITIGDDTLISGLSIDLSSVGRSGVLNTTRDRVLSGIVVEGNNFAVEDNIITGTRHGINIIETGGDITIARNEISLTDNRTDGIHFQQDSLQGEAQAAVTIVENDITNVGGNGIALPNTAGSTQARFVIDDNYIGDSARIGITTGSVTGASSADLQIINNIIDTTTTNFSEGISLGGSSDTASSNIVIDNNIIDSTAGDSIQTGRNTGNSSTRIVITNNQLGDVEGEGNGISINNSSDVSEVDITINNNDITEIAGNGISIADIRDNSKVTITINGNTIGEDDGEIEGNGIELVRIREAAEVAATINDNTISGTTGNGVSITRRPESNFCLELNNNDASVMTSNGFSFITTGAGTFEVIDLANITMANTGSFIPADISANSKFVSRTRPCTQP